MSLAKGLLVALVPRYITSQGSLKEYAQYVMDFTVFCWPDLGIPNRLDVEHSGVCRGIMDPKVSGYLELSKKAPLACGYLVPEVVNSN